MKIAVIGSGAMGCLYGGYLGQQHEVLMIDADASQVEAIEKFGIRTEGMDGRLRTCDSARAFTSGSCDESVDLVLVFVKSNNTREAIAENRMLFQSDTAVMTLQNGAGNDRVIAEYVSEQKIVIGNSKHNALNLGEGRIKHGAVGSTTIGSNSGMREEVTRVAEVMRQVGLEVVVSDDIQRVIWSKLLVNLSINTFTAITQTPIGYMVKNEHAWDFAKRLVYEAIEVAEADGTYFDRREALNMVRGVCEKAGNGYSSMYQDRARGVKMEIDAINGAIVEQAKQYGVPTPYNSLIVDIIHAIEGAYDLY